MRPPFSTPFANGLGFTGPFCRPWQSRSGPQPRLQPVRAQVVVDLERLVDPRIVGQVVDVEVRLEHRAGLPPQHGGLAAP